ncbi:glycosyltransferase family A protein [Flavobacteriaceae bacterium SZ-1-7]|uniref:glycosyltransferase family 2 protein n=1 Tax=Tamlana sedimenti TaxID=3134126 RepID=UPI0031267738
MLSILIPTYNYNIVSLVKELHKQAEDCNIDFEILVYDDASEIYYSDKNSIISQLKNTSYTILKQNVGRSIIRNLLAKNAKNGLLLFVDAGTFPKSKDFIKIYLNHTTNSVICGGMTNTEKPPQTPFKLRWIYTKEREANTLCSSNFLIKKELMLQYPFDESLNKYGYEDVLFFNNLIDNSIEVELIKNQVIHFDDDDAATYIKNTEYAIENLVILEKSKKLQVSSSKILKYHNILNKLGLSTSVAALFKLSKKIILKNLNSSRPSLLVFDFYRLGYFCNIKNEE